MRSFTLSTQVLSTRVVGRYWGTSVRFQSAQAVAAEVLAQFESITSPSPFFTVDRSRQSGVALLQFNSKPVNLITKELMTDFNTSLKHLENDKDTTAVIISSTNPKVFTAGLNLNEMLVDKTDVEKYIQFRDPISENFFVLQEYTKPLVALIPGYCPGQGTITSICCDYRVMLRTMETPEKKPVVMGLNESQIGLVVPDYVAAVFAYLIGPLKAERMLTEGKMIGADEAAAVGLVDVAVDSKAEGVAKAEEFIREQLKIDPFVRAGIKAMMRKPFLDIAPRTKAQRQERSTANFQRLSDPKIKRVLEGFAAKLGKGKK